MTKQFPHSTFRKEIRGFILLLLPLLLFSCNNEVTDIEYVKYDIQFYQKLDGKISMKYPVLVGEEYSAINEVIYNEALFVLKYYGTTLPEKLCIKVTTFFQNDRYLNIVYEGTGQLDGESKVNRYKYTLFWILFRGKTTLE